MAQSLFYVKLINKGRTIETTVQAHTPPEAKQFAENMHPGYKAMTAQRIS
jgi:hypothetical protein